MAPRNMHHAVDREPHPKMLAGTAQSAILGGGNTNHRKDLHSAAIGARIRFQTEDSHWLAVWRVSGRYGIRCADNLRPFCASLDDRLILFAVGVSEDFVQLHTPPPVDHHLSTSVDCSSRRGAAKASWPATAESPDHRETQATIAKLVRSCGCAALLRMSRHRGAALSQCRTCRRPQRRRHRRARGQLRVCLVSFAARRDGEGATARLDIRARMASLGRVRGQPPLMTEESKPSPMHSNPAGSPPRVCNEFLDFHFD